MSDPRLLDPDLEDDDEDEGPKGCKAKGACEFQQPTGNIECFPGMAACPPEGGRQAMFHPGTTCKRLGYAPTPTGELEKGGYDAYMLRWYPNGLRHSDGKVEFFNLGGSFNLGKK